MFLSPSSPNSTPRRSFSANVPPLFLQLEPSKLLATGAKKESDPVALSVTALKRMQRWGLLGNEFRPCLILIGGSEGLGQSMACAGRMAARRRPRKNAAETNDVFVGIVVDWPNGRMVGWSDGQMVGVDGRFPLSSSGTKIFLF